VTSREADARFAASWQYPEIGPPGGGVHVYACSTPFRDRTDHRHRSCLRTIRTGRSKAEIHGAAIVDGREDHPRGQIACSQVGLVSDGYAVIGGGDSSDVTFNPQDLPDPSRPNTLVAPFWTDLNTDFGGSMSIGTLTDGVDSWIVMEWTHVSLYSTADTVSFQIWLQDDATESVTFAYGPDVPTAGDPAPVAWVCRSPRRTATVPARWSSPRCRLRDLIGRS
jgi:hypothetical protein